MILRIIAVSLRNLARQPFRTFLILQGVIWGTALGLFPPAVIQGSQRFVESQAGQLGTDRLLITQDPDALKRFDWPLVDSLRADYPGVVRHATAMDIMRTKVSRFIATDAGSLAARGLRIERGRFFTATEVRQAARVCVLEHYAAESIFPETDPIGKTVRLLDIELEVIGVTASRAADGEVLDELGYHKEHPMRALLDEMKQYVGVFSDESAAELTDDRAALFPHTVAKVSKPAWIELRADPQEVLRLRDQLQNKLASEGYEPVIYANAILPVLYGETIKTAIELNRAIFVLCTCVGTAVVCSIMVLSVVERQREIAIRRVEGARQWHIAFQFVVETGTLCTVGAIVGIPLGMLLAIVRCALEPHGSVTWAFPPIEASILVAVVTSIGLVGGLLPAWRATRVDPVEMLRYE